MALMVSTFLKASTREGTDKEIFVAYRHRLFI